MNMANLVLDPVPSHFTAVIFAAAGIFVTASSATGDYHFSPIASAEPVEE